MLHSRRWLSFTLFAIFTGQVSAEDSVEFGRTVGRLNEQFKGFVMSRKDTKEGTVSALKYQLFGDDLEGYSKQNILSVTVAVHQNGGIMVVKPNVFKADLPSQKAVNADIDSGIKASDFFSKHSLDKLEEVQVYGLLSRWAIAVLARRDGVQVNLELLDEQKKLITKLYGRGLPLPELTSLDDQAKIKKIESYAKEVIRYDAVQFDAAQGGYRLTR